MILHLHSTMYLLNREVNPKAYEHEYNLHSTMYLLNPGLAESSSSVHNIYIPLCIY